MMNLKVIFHIDDEKRWSRVLGNVKNLLNQVDSDEIQIEVLGNGDAVKEYVKNFGEGEETIGSILMKNLSDKNVRFVACNNSLNGLHIKKEDLNKFVSIVPAGVLELVLKQKEGYAYIKP